MLLQTDQAGPLWLAFESLMEWLGFWGRIAVGAIFLLTVAIVVVLMLQRKAR